MDQLPCSDVHVWDLLLGYVVLQLRFISAATGQERAVTCTSEKARLQPPQLRHCCSGTAALPRPPAAPRCGLLIPMAARRGRPRTPAFWHQGPAMVGGNLISRKGGTAQRGVRQGTHAGARPRRPRPSTSANSWSSTRGKQDAGGRAASSARHQRSTSSMLAAPRQALT